MLSKRGNQPRDTPLPDKNRTKPARDREADKRRLALRRALQESELTPAEAARLANLGNPNSFYNFFAGRTKGLSAETYRKLAQVIPGATVASLQGLEHSSPSLGRTVQVRAEARAGVVQPSFDMPLPDQFEAPVPIDQGMRANGAFGVVVRHPGADLLFPENTILVILPVAALTDTLSAGRKVILQRICPVGVEVTVRELQVRDGKAWLCQRSANPEYNTAIEMPWPGDHTKMWKKGDDRYSIAGVVVGAYIPDL